MKKIENMTLMEKQKKLSWKPMINFLKQQTASYSGNKERALIDYCGAIMSANEFVDALQNGKNLDAEDAFKIAMSSKVGDALEDKRKEVAGSLIQNHIPEVEEDETV